MKNSCPQWDSNELENVFNCFNIIKCAIKISAYQILVVSTDNIV